MNRNGSQYIINQSQSASLSEFDNRYWILLTGTGSMKIDYHIRNLFQNYPNPFNPTTKIKFDIPAGTSGTGGRQVRLVIYDALGRGVSTLIDSELKPGSYETDWDSINFPSGVYFYRLEAGTFVSTKKNGFIKIKEFNSPQV